MSDSRGWAPRRGRGGFRGRFDRGGGGGRGFRGRRDMDFRGGPFGPYGQGGFRGNDQGLRDNFNQWMRPQRDMPTKKLSEEEIAVTHYISDHQGFNGIIKSRYSDFQVSEINEQGEVAKLTSLAAPKPPVEKKIEEDEDLLLSKYDLEILPMETWDNINKLVMSDDTDEKVEIDATGMTKEQRTKIHDAVKKAFTDTIVGSTVTVKSEDTEEEKKIVRFEKYRKGVRIDTRVKWVWPGEYVYFIVHKENCDTMDAALQIAERLRVNLKPSLLGYAGTKDRRAKTSQWFSARRVEPRRLAAAGRGLRDLRLGNYRFGARALRLGMLAGNMFRIALRNVTASDETVEAACGLLRDRGFINYYGLQRFGSRRDTPTYLVGLKLLQGHFQEAIEAILSERDGGGALGEALAVYRAAGPEAAARALPRAALGVEARLLRALARAPRDRLGALHSVSRNTRLLYLHSYQSLVWNRAASERLRRLGLAPAAGDLVPVDHVAAEDAYFDMESDGEEDDTEGQEDAAADNKDNKTTDDKATDNKTTDNSSSSEKDKSKSKKDKDNTEPAEKVKTKILTQEDVDSGKYTIFDIVLPLPGSNIEYPPNMKDYYEELLFKDNLTLELKHKYKSYSMSGAYRRLVVRPGALSWRCVRYDAPHADLLLSDRDELEGRQLTGIVEDGKYKALLLTMTLPPSCYATMALRELLKVDTSSDNQALQNNYHKWKKEGIRLDGDSKTDTEEKSETADENGGKRKLSESEEVDSKKSKQEDE